MLSYPKGTLPRLHLVDNEIAGSNNFVGGKVFPLAIEVVVATFPRNDPEVPIDREKWEVGTASLLTPTE
jgi:hypothetical protein